MKMFKIVSLLVLTVFAMSSMSFTFAAPMTNNNLVSLSNSTVSPDTVPDSVDLTVKLGELFTLPYTENMDYSYYYMFDDSYFHQYSSYGEQDLFKAVKQGNRTIIADIDYYDDNHEYVTKTIEYHITVTP